MELPRFDSKTLTILRYSEVDKAIDRIRKYKHKDGSSPSIEERIVFLTRLETRSKQLGYPIASIKHEVERWEHRQMMIDELVNGMAGNAYFLTMSTLPHKSYSEKLVKDKFKMKLQQVNTALYGRRWKQNELWLSGVLLLESHDKMGHSICPHIHAIVAFPDDTPIQDFSGDQIEVDYIFQHGVKLFGGDGTYQAPPKIIKDINGNAVFSGVEIEPIDLSLADKLGEYFVKTPFRGDVVTHASEDTAGLFEFVGDSILRIS